jgi:superfamily II DNA or RNA helicase
VYYIHGGTEADDREEIRRIVATQANAIIVGSYGTMSTGVDIPNLDNIIFASPYKSKIKVLQSIGRGLRRPDGKTHCTLFDIADDLTHKTHHNHTINHFMKRIEIYNTEGFDYKIYRIAINE